MLTKGAGRYVAHPQQQVRRPRLKKPETVRWRMRRLMDSTAAADTVHQRFELFVLDLRRAFSESKRQQKPKLIVAYPWWGSRKRL